MRSLKEVHRPVEIKTAVGRRRLRGSKRKRKKNIGQGTRGEGSTFVCYRCPVAVGSGLFKLFLCILGEYLIKYLLSV